MGLVPGPKATQWVSSQSKEPSGKHAPAASSEGLKTGGLSKETEMTLRTPATSQPPKYCPVPQGWLLIKSSVGLCLLTAAWSWD